MHLSDQGRQMENLELVAQQAHYEKHAELASGNAASWTVATVIPADNHAEPDMITGVNPVEGPILCHVLQWFDPVLYGKAVVLSGVSCLLGSPEDDETESMLITIFAWPLMWGLCISSIASPLPCIGDTDDDIVFMCPDDEAMSRVADRVQDEALMALVPALGLPN